MKEEKLILAKNKTIVRVVALFLVLIMGFSGSVNMAFADTVSAAGTTESTESTEVTEETEETMPPDEEAEEVPSTEIAEIGVLSGDILTQQIVAYSGKKPQLPNKISVRMSDSEEFKNLDISWKCNKTFNNKVAGTYKYTGRISSDYTFIKGVSLPKITVKVTKCKTKINGAAKNLTKKSRSTLYDTVTVYNGYGAVLKIQMMQSGKWVTKKKITLKNTAKQKIKVKFPKNWWYVASSKWRMKIDAGKGTTGVTTKKCTVKTKRYYQNPSRYVQIKNDIPKHESGGYTLKPGYFGLKVQKVNRYFDIGSYHHPCYTSTTKYKVKAFQKKHGLKQTGYVNKSTWLAMGLPEAKWYDARISKTDVNQASTRKQHVDAMITRAKEYLGDPYVYGAAGYPNEGIDCSGLVIQCLYASGVDPYPICSATHAYPENQYNSRKLYNYKGFKKVSYSNKKRGDLVFYSGPSGYVNHVAIYLGDGKIIEAYPNKVRITNINYHRVTGIRRVFI